MRPVAALARVPAWPLAALLAALYLVIDPPSADLAAATYRTWLFRHAGFTVWDDGWYAGHHVPAYSILFPPLAGWLGPRVVGALAAVGAAWAFERLAIGARGAAARPAALWFAVATSASLVSGRLTFALGLAFGVAAMLALVRAPLVVAALLALATTLASPVAGAFLVLGVAAWALPRRRFAAGAAMAAAALVPALALTVAFPEGGDFPFVASAFWPSLAATLVLLLVIPRGKGTLRLGVFLYALLLVVSVALATPMGGNAVRLGAIFAGPIAVLALRRERWGVLVLLIPALVYWQWTTPVDDWRQASADASVHPSYYRGLLGFLQRQPGGPFRIEIPFTDNHWESARVAPRVPLARGWERQYDRKVNPLFYDGRPLTAPGYRAWLDENAVRFVALADAPIDYSAAAEARLIRSRPSYLREVWRDAHWRVFEVAHATPLATGARVTRLGIDDVVLDAPRPGRVLLRVRWTPYWQLTEGHGCVAGATDGWTTLRLRSAGVIRLRASFSLSRIRATSPRCR